MALSKEILDLQKKYAEGEVIFSEDDLSRDLYVLLKGKVEVLQKGVRLAVIEKPGEFIGEMAMLSGQPRSATLRAVELEGAAMLQVAPDKLPVLVKTMPDLAMRMAKKLADAVRNQNKDLLRAREAMALQDMLKTELEANPRATLEETLPRVFKELRQQQHEAMLEVARSYLRSRVFIEPFLQSVNKTLSVFFNHALSVKVDAQDSRVVLERFCGVDFQGAMAGTFIFMATSAQLKELGVKIFGNEMSETMENDALMELARRIIASVKTEVPGLHLEISSPEMMQAVDPNAEFVGMKIKTDVGFAAWIHLNG